ncbi:hypothetical protein OsccyDRAFT_0614 [Leptolyngbyaceae cyanobacterium JSC-12]|nr:hypothetical protein OsccyDRAFT_0614 [Leptolyngbyaceae cyanobacterium JSC-12]
MITLNEQDFQYIKKDVVKIHELSAQLCNGINGKNSQSGEELVYQIRLLHEYSLGLCGYIEHLEQEAGKSTNYELRVTIIDGEHEYDDAITFNCPNSALAEDYAKSIACTYLDGEDDDGNPIWTGTPFSNDNANTFCFEEGEDRLIKYRGFSLVSVKEADIAFDEKRLEYYQSVAYTPKQEVITSCTEQYR